MNHSLRKDRKVGQREFDTPLNVKPPMIRKPTDEVLLGALYGLVVGDALGSRYEFLRSVEATKLVAKDNGQMLGAGPFNNIAGQTSDDSEMMLCLLRSIAENRRYVQSDVAQRYIEWFDSNPIDIGRTIRAALYTRERSKNHQDMVANSREMNMSSLSNGVLMRIAPIGLLDISNKELYSAVEKECALTHPNTLVKNAAFIYCRALRYIAHGYDKKEIIDRLLKKDIMPRIKITLQDAKFRPEPIYVLAERCEELYVNTDDKKYQGYMGVALQNAFYELANGVDYNTSMLNIIKRGGDTDTNCAIAGALLGAYYGINMIDQSWLSTVKNATYGRIERFPQYASKNIDKYVDVLLKK